MFPSVPPISRKKKPMQREVSNLHKDTDYYIKKFEKREEKKGKKKITPEEEEYNRECKEAGYLTWDQFYIPERGVKEEEKRKRKKKKVGDSREWFL